MVPMAKPTTKDAELIFDLLELVGTERSQEARAWVLREFSAADYDGFIEKYPQGSKEFQHVTTVLGFFEVAGVLVSHGLVNEDLFFDLGFGIGLFWPKLAPIIPGWRKATSAAFWENAVWLEERSQVWSKTVWKPGLKWKLQSR